MPEVREGGERVTGLSEVYWQGFRDGAGWSSVAIFALILAVLLGINIAARLRR